jgi:two-component system phosphate regulon sensor histidine kinase PhoR
VRQHEIIALWQQCHRTGDEQTELVEVGRQGPFLQAIVTSLGGVEPGAYLVILQDLTRVRQLETVRRDFVSNISHELRTPLASLKALSETLRDGALEDPPAAKRFIDRMDIEVDALTQMVQELLELSRIESGQVPVRLTSVALREIIIPPVERLRPQAARAGIDLTVESDDRMPAVLADPERIQQVVTNLVHNAIKFTPAGGSVRVSSALRGDEVVVFVRDTGVGIPADDLPRIFERFYKADRARTGGGTGLGLAIARHIVRAHGGEIGAESIEGRGSAFHFTLPLARPVGSGEGR